MIFKMHLQQNLSAYLSVPHGLFIYQLNWQINIYYCTTGACISFQSPLTHNQRSTHVKKQLKALFPFYMCYINESNKTSNHKKQDCFT